ncbi:sugar transferase [Anoxynatronum sibiricum]|uniref:Sugar transferase n=1 Tax=Anoxynatronum sibiricum TaxID=210623 RepID=A0ABU9VXX9_9CLOT
MQSGVKQETRPSIGGTINKGIYRRFLKRPMDFILSLMAIIALSPVLIIIAIFVRLKLGSPVLFKQKRPGLNEKIFTMYKFRTMTDEKDENGELLPDSVRLTKFGRMLRSTSLDELPELFNILKGDMSIVGPRPLAVQYLPYYTENERLRHSVRPGLSGLAQINGRNTATWEERFSHDIRYIKTISFACDLSIIIKTTLKAVKRSDIGERGVDAPMDFHVYRQKLSKGEDANEY